MFDVPKISRDLYNSVLWYLYIQVIEICGAVGTLMQAKYTEDFRGCILSGQIAIK